MKRLRLGFAVMVVAPGLLCGQQPVKGPAEDGTKPALVRIAGHATMDSPAFEWLTELSDQIGARVTGTPGDRAAIEWGLAKMKAIGLQNVHTEKYSVWRGWTRGPAEAELLAPLRHKVEVDSVGWAGSTPAGGVTADVALVNVFNLDNEIKNAAANRGKIVLLKAIGAPKGGFAGVFAQLGQYARAAHKAGVAAIIGGDYGLEPEGLHLTHTGIYGFAADFEIPIVGLTREDQGQIERLLADGKTVRMHLNVQNKFTDGPVESANVVGEIPGRETANEVVVAGAHLDSWDLSEGSTDNGTGVTCVLAAADAIVKSGEKPRRTIRFVLFTGEEEGLLGSLAYAKQHASEMKNHLAAVILDFGQGPIKEFQLGGRDDLIASFEPFAKSLENIRDIKVSDKTEFETDTGAFILAGLPGINLDQDSPEYKYTHHSAADALEAVKPDVLTQNATILALTVYWLADRPERFSMPWTPERSARMLRENGQVDWLKAFGIWPFAELGQ